MAGLADAIRAVAPNADVGKWEAPLAAALAKFSAGTPRRAAAALGQFTVESGGFTKLKEDLYYTTPSRICAVYPSHIPNVAVASTLCRNPDALANIVYANRLGNTAPTDGATYAGKGLIQLTGKSIYTQFAAAMGMTVEDAAAYCLTPDGAAMSGVWFLSARGCLVLADTWSISAITRAVNGVACLGLAERIAASNAALKVLT
jgi:putative chitinase